MKGLLVTISWLAFGVSLLGQIDTSVVIDDVIIKDQLIRNEFSDYKLIKENTNPGSIVDVLEDNSNVYIKNYGAGSLSTLSMRGGSAGQSLVLWNGLPLQSPMLGLLDLSLIPAGATESTQIIKGGNSSLWGSGAVSGILNLENKKTSDFTIKNTISIGSYGALNEQLILNLKGKNIHSVTKYIHESSDRDFEYDITAQLSRKQTNARYKRDHLFQDFYLDINANNKISAHIWAYKAYTEIPPNAAQTNSVSYQEDSAIRTNLLWMHVGKSWIINSRVGLFVDNNDFYNPSIQLEALNDFTTGFIDINAQYQSGYHILSFGSTYNQTKATSQGYQGSTNERKIALFTAYKLNLQKINLKCSLRQELVDDSFAPFLPNIKLSYLPFDWLSTYIGASKNFRYPTLNDRHWIPGGNENLLPENGWSGEFGLHIHKSINNTSLSFNINGFYRDMKNWILWSPGENVPFWAAQNINNVISQGIEQEAKFQYKTEGLSIGIDVGYDYIRSEFQSDLTLPRVNAGDQLLYTPKHNAYVNLRVMIEDFTFHYHHRRTGESKGVNELIPSFQVGNASLKYNSQFKNIKYILFTAINNIWDERYFIIERRPMVGRNYSIGLTIKY